MKKTLPIKKLTVQRDTVRALGDSDLRDISIAGGKTVPPTWSKADADGGCDCFPPPLRGAL